MSAGGLTAAPQPVTRRSRRRTCRRSRVRSLFPERSGCLDVYDYFGLLGRKSVLAHGVHLTARERLRLHETGSAVAHCPTSTCSSAAACSTCTTPRIRSADVRRFGHEHRGGDELSLLATRNEAYNIAELISYPMNSVKSFYLATLGGAEALDLTNTIGSLEVGKEADFVVLDPHGDAATGLQDRAGGVHWFVLSIIGDDRSVAATYVAGDPAYQRGDLWMEIRRTDLCVLSPTRRSGCQESPEIETDVAPKTVGACSCIPPAALSRQPLSGALRCTTNLVVYLGTGRRGRLTVAP
jgi:cytosine/adenosine deaminase-related metal-dependent hydrolase